MGLHPSLYCSWGGDHAGISGQALWRTPDPNVHVCPVPGALHFHETIYLFSGVLFIKVSLGWNLYWSIGVLLLITTMYSVAGGLSAVIYTDAVQTVIMVAGALTLMFIAFCRVGWYEGLMEHYMAAVPMATVANTTCHLPRSDAFHIFRDPLSADLPWPGLIFGLTVIATWVWCTDQVTLPCPILVHSFGYSVICVCVCACVQFIVQRSLSAKSLSHAKGGSVLGGYLKILPMFFIVMPGMISRALFPDEVACVDPEVCQRVCGASVGCSNIAYPKLVVELMPVGVRGLMLAVMFASLLSSLTSIFNSSSTIFTLDLYHQARHTASEMELMIVGRVFILVLVCVSILWIPVIQSANSGQLFEYGQSVVSFLAPPITGVFLMAIFWSRANEQGAFWGLMVGLVVGLIRMILEFSYEVPLCGEPDQRPAILTEVHYLYFAILLMVLTCLIVAAVSLATPPIPAEHLHRLTWWSRHSKEACVSLTNPLMTSDSASPSVPPSASCWRRAVMQLCGLTGASSGSPAAESPKLNSLKEAPLWRNVCNVNALVLLAVNVFLWGYFA
ncbi:sodium/glucose cotransporter 4 isoform X2 [Dunckerocampus dactyliophorus]|uniref:sodium/glucose cotransporter 4 isoform X2 n=1 Tax=Dunckerocampus dactyliophorus TaxID=161453 RepID=UPI002405B0BE|nr:sodium/glucose cotransporter 4 isoform X2 [Dunckerocampus dactyliophorus]